MLKLVTGITRMQFKFDNFTEVMDYFKRMINTLRQMNYSEFQSDDFKRFEQELEQIISERAIR